MPEANLTQKSFINEELKEEDLEWETNNIVFYACQAYKNVSERFERKSAFLSGAMYNRAPFFKDRRVRMAVNHAIDKDRMIREAFLSYAMRADSVTSPLHFGHEPEVEIYDYNPARARELLAEAGYPEGFTVDFFVSVSEQAAEDIARDLKAVGIETRFHWMGGRWDQFYEKFLQGEMPLALVTWGSYSMFDASAILNPFFMGDARGCYGTTPEINALLTEAGQTLDQERRGQLFSRAQKKISSEALWVPLCTTQAISLMHKNLCFQPAYDEIDRYFLATWKGQGGEVCSER